MKAACAPYPGGSSTEHAPFSTAHLHPPHGPLQNRGGPGVRAGRARETTALTAHRGLRYANVDDQTAWRFLDPATGVASVVDIPSSLKINNGDALREATIAGFGIARLPTFIIYRAVQAGQLRVLLDQAAVSAVG